MRRLWLVLLLVLCGCGSDGKNEDTAAIKNDPIVATGTCGFGWIKDPNPAAAPQYASIRRVAAANIPATLDMRADLSPVENQGPINSCVAQATVGALEFLQMKAGIPKGKRFLDMSRMFIYWNARDMAGLQTKDAGCYISSALTSCMNTGVVSESRYPYTYSRLFRKPAATLYRVAAKHKTTAYWIADNHVENIKAALAEGYPVIFGTALFSSFRSVGADGMVPVPKLPGESFIGGHAMLIVGYTQTHYIVRNSWGAGWGDKGYCYMPFEYFAMAGGSYNPSWDYWVITGEANMFMREAEPQ